MKEGFEDFGSIGIEGEGNHEKSAEDSADDLVPRMPLGCRCQPGVELKPSCLTCGVRVEARKKLAEEHGLETKQVIDVIDESGYCVSCDKVKPLHGSRRAPFVATDERAKREDAAEKRIICAGCCLNDDEHGC
jgi:hypothetical protein